MQSSIFAIHFEKHNFKTYKHKKPAPKPFHYLKIVLEQ